jgi:hypothetical protein
MTDDGQDSTNITDIKTRHIIPVKPSYTKNRGLKKKFQIFININFKCIRISGMIFINRKDFDLIVRSLFSTIFTNYL